MSEPSIFLTDQADKGAGVANMSKQVMLAVTGFYKTPDKADGFRKTYGLGEGHVAGWDSGGFQFLMGKLGGVPTTRLPCGIDVPVNAGATIDLYKRIGAKPQDMPMQLDLPAKFDQSAEERMQLIETSARYYWEMVQEIPWTIPVVHGWTEGEVKHSLQLLEQPEKLAAGTFWGSNVEWVLGKLNPHVKAVGTFKAFTTVDHMQYVNNSANPRRVATPVPSRVDAGIQSPDNTPMVACPKRVAAGTFMANYTGPLGEKMSTGAVKKTRIPYSVIVDRMAMVLNLLRDKYEVFMLGGASPNTQHQVFLGGAKWTDTSAWRVKALMAEIYLPEHSRGYSSFGVGSSKKSTPLDDEAREILHGCLADERHPYSGMSVERFLQIAHLYMDEWHAMKEQEHWEETPFKIRALHNAYVLKCREEEIAREYAADPDGYYRYLAKRFVDRPIISKQLDAFWEKMKRPYVQQDIRVYLKGDMT